MVAPARVVTKKGKEYTEPYLLRLPGWSEERYFREAPERQFAEFEDGELIMCSPVGTRHQAVVRFLTVLLSSFVEDRGLGTVLNGPTVVRLRPGLDYEPDVFFVAADRLTDIKEQYYEGAHPLVIEVISPSTRARDLTTKAANYRQHGVLEYWAVEFGRRTIYVHSLPPDPSAPYVVSQWSEASLASLAVPGFWVDVSWLWQYPLPTGSQCLRQILGEHPGA